MTSKTWSFKLWSNCSKFDTWPIRPYNVSVPNELFEPMNTELWAKEVGEFFIMCMTNWAGGHSFAHHHCCYNINAWKLCKLCIPVIHVLNSSIYRPETWRDFSKPGYQHRKSCQKISSLKFFDDVIANQEYHTNNQTIENKEAIHIAFSTLKYVCTNPVDGLSWEQDYLDPKKGGVNDDFLTILVFLLSLMTA